MKEWYRYSILQMLPVEVYFYEFRQHHEYTCTGRYDVRMSVSSSTEAFGKTADCSSFTAVGSELERVTLDGVSLFSFTFLRCRWIITEEAVGSSYLHADG